jgi:hypothetical protein
LLLASNLPAEQWAAAKVVAVYKRRMQIEEGFRDVKSEHLGFDLLLTLMFMEKPRHVRRGLYRSLTFFVLMYF